MTDSPIRILIADDHALVREGIRRVLDEDPGFDVVAEASDGRKALESIEEMNPDVAILDISMPELSGLEVARRLREERPAVKILILSMHDESEYVMRAVHAGAAGYLLKDDAGPALLRQAVRAVHEGDSYFSPAVAARLTDALRGGSSGSADPLERLTGRELEVLRLVAAGHSNKQIAAELGISRRTVESHRESMMRKIEIRTVAGLTRFALENGLLDDID
ncbi:MAG: response regulator transcription factor [marine benthic group bacterium]|jgi:DNA-binding NarL/FixJ family response regulator|nr:response regulator transcription factor [Gemmatimonadota bacterium]MCL7975905.1 response regulator transcription factor [Gemmatimonadota bacterium]MCL7982728.1 response regulator transcription factor [Gemmatimonadota bacterium]MCL7985809.1 response regulator transcription factor [Gemmatimonadota bacterium]